MVVAALRDHLAPGGSLAVREHDLGLAVHALRLGLLVPRLSVRASGGFEKSVPRDHMVLRFGVVARPLVRAFRFVCHPIAVTVFVMVTVIASLAGLMLLFFYIRPSIILPLRQLTRAMRDISAGQPANLPDMSGKG